MTNVVKFKPNIRWRAVIEYRSETGTVDVEHFFEEIADLDGIIERGPDWNAMIRCTVTLNRVINGGLTVEEAERQ